MRIKHEFDVQNSIRHNQTDIRRIMANTDWTISPQYSSTLNSKSSSFQLWKWLANVLPSCSESMPLLRHQTYEIHVKVKSYGFSFWCFLCDYYGGNWSWADALHNIIIAISNTIYHQKERLLNANVSYNMATICSLIGGPFIKKLYR
jgi:hypothetical protein